MASCILAWREELRAEVRVLKKEQHRRMLKQVQSFSSIYSDKDLNFVRPNQSLTILMENMLFSMDGVLIAEEPDVVLLPCHAMP
jgi:UDP-N-acetylglucosamine 2-epimerase (non-hydrolysing)